MVPLVLEHCKTPIWVKFQSETLLNALLVRADSCLCSGSDMKVTHAAMSVLSVMASAATAYSKTVLVLI